MRKRLRVFFAVVALIAVVLAYLYHTAPSGKGITLSNAQRIKNGMTVAEVEAIFGCPPGVYGGPHVVPFTLDFVEPHTTMEWEGESVCVVIFADGDGRVLGSVPYQPLPDARSYLRRIWDWLKSFAI